MCIGAAVLGSGATSGAIAAYNIGLGLSAATSFLGMQAAQQQAEQVAEQAFRANESAERDKRQKQMALAEAKKEKEAKAAQDKLAKSIDALQARSAIVASEQSGSTIGLLLMDRERQAANARESINQSLESFGRQYVFNIQQTESQFENRRNELQSNINQAYNQIPSLGQTLLNIGMSGLNLYSSLA